MVKKRRNKDSLVGINKDLLIIVGFVFVLFFVKFIIKPSSSFGFSIIDLKNAGVDFFDEDANPIRGISSVLQGQQDVRYMKLSLDITNGGKFGAEFSLNESEIYCEDIGNGRWRDSICTKNIIRAFTGEDCGMIGAVPCKVAPGESGKIKSSLICIDNDNCATDGFEDPFPYVDPSAFYMESCKNCAWQGGTSCVKPYNLTCPNYMANGCTMETLYNCDTSYGCAVRSVEVIKPGETKSINCDEGFNLKLYENRFSKNGFEYEGKSLKFIFGTYSYSFIDETCHECPWSWFPGEKCLMDGYGVKCPEIVYGCLAKSYENCNKPNGCVLINETIWVSGEGSNVNCAVGRSLKLYDFVPTVLSQSWIQLIIREDYAK